MAIDIYVQDCADGTVINSGSTYSGSVLSGGILVLPNVTNIDTDGTPVVTPAQVGFTASTCPPPTCPSRTWVRNPDWLAMPSLSDGDNTIYILSAVKSGFNNFFSFSSTLTSGTYEVDLYNDGTTVTTHSAGQADFNLDYSKGTAEITDNGDDYKQVITKITGNFLYPLFNARHASVSNENLSGILSIKMASQTTTSLYGSFSNSTVNAILNRFEEFEYVGTCNVTSLRFAFSRCRVLGKVTGNFRVATNMQGTFAYGGDVNLDDMQTNQSGLGFFRQTFDSNNLMREIVNQDYFNNISDLGQTLRSMTALLYFGTPSAPMDMGGYSAGASQVFQNNTVLRHAYFQNFTPNNISNMYSGCEAIQIISGIDCTNVTNSTYAFRYCHSLERLEISNMKISFSLEDCNFYRAGLVNVFTDLYDLTTIPSTASITIIDNPGTAVLTAADELIATDKGWTIIKI